MDLSASFKNFFPSFPLPWPTPEVRFDREEELPPPERGWSDVASDIYSVVKWLFEAFRGNFIVCYLSSHISEADRSVQVIIPRMIDRWFNAQQIPFSSRMNPDALIQGLNQVEALKKGTLAVLIVAFDERLSPEITAEVFVREHVMILRGEDTKKIPNPADRFPFWLSTQDLKYDFQTLHVSVLKDLKRGMGVDPDLGIDPFVEHCRDKMGQLRTQLELLRQSEEE
ncbi:MAG: hypothetical protein H7A41_06135 [Chlamydiales bacterium]|nr:hypothetical protein [Chlamydiales bacterium]